MRPFSAFLMAALLWAAVPALAAPNPRVAEARKLIDDLEFEAAVKVLDAAEKAAGNDRETVLEILTLQGVAFGTLGKEAKTRDSFRKLLMLDPGATLPPDLPPRVRTPFLEAKEWAATNGPLTARPGVELSGGLVRSVKLTLEKDLLRQARAARFHLTVEGVEQVVEAPFTAGVAVASVDRPAVSWWAELLNERKGVLVEVGSARAPRQEWTGENPVVPATRSVTDAAPVSGGWRRPTGFVLLGAGAVAAGVGLVLGVQSADGRARLTNATRDEQGRVTGLTQARAGALEASANAQASVANLLFGVGGALGAAGVVFVVLGPVTEPVVSLSPAPGGLVATGRF